ncbi:MAG TPA: LysR family transcriptional regulator [Chthoniobacterales bacterium]|jgi:DNA-binding transcriptional LysR family regulator|nr:LysR family transcriptional regulator [Chthoniobacterales bacterium]
MAIELRWLRSFVAVADEMHFSRAARRLRLAQPALSAQIRHLEHQIGSPLFERTNRMRGLTIAGQALLPEARALVERSDSLPRIVKQSSLGETGLLRLGVIPPAATTTVARSLRRFVKEYPGVELRVRQGGQDRLADELLTGEIDLVIGRHSASRSFKQRRLFTEEQGILLNEDDPLAKLPLVSVTSLADRRLVLLRDNPRFGQLLLTHAAKHGIRLFPIHIAEDFPSLHWLVRAGLGIAPCSLLLADGLPRGLAASRIKPAPEKLEVNAIWKGTGLPASAGKFLQILCANMRG